MSTPVFETCSQVSEACPVSATMYGYVPSLAGNTTVDTVFGLALLAHIIITILPPRSTQSQHRRRHWPYAIFAFVGFTFEFVGYLSRIWMISDVWNQAAVAVQLILLILGPTFLVASIYLVLKHVALHLGTEHSRILSPRLYPWVFVSCDVVSILIQVIGGGLAAFKTNKSSSLSYVQAGNAVIIVGIVLQIVIMLVVFALSFDYARQYWTARRSVSSTRKAPLTNESEEDLEKTAGAASDLHISPISRRWQCFLSLIAAAYLFIFIRCIYRIVEFSGGWAGAPMRNEPSFLVLDGAMMALACICLTVGQPPLMFKEMFE